MVAVERSTAVVVQTVVVVDSTVDTRVRAAAVEEPAVVVGVARGAGPAVVVQTVVVGAALVRAGENAAAVVERTFVVVVLGGGCRGKAAVAGDDRDSAVAAAAVGTVSVNHADAGAGAATKLPSRAACDRVHRVELAAIGVADLRQRDGVCARAAPASRRAPASDFGQVARGGFRTAGQVTEADQGERTVDVAHAEGDRARGCDPHAATTDEIKRCELAETTRGHHSKGLAAGNMVRPVPVVVPFDVHRNLVAKGSAWHVVVLELGSLQVVVRVAATVVGVRRVVPATERGGRGREREVCEQGVKTKGKRKEKRGVKGEGGGRVKRMWER